MSVSLEITDPSIAVLTVDRPQVRNALDWGSIDTFSQLIEQAHKESSLNAMILAGAGGSFISGGDLKVLQDYPGAADGARLSEMVSRMLNRLEALPCPTIAAINGPARGGGAEISLACDLRIMSDNADLGLVQINLGLTPGWGAGQRLLRLVGYSRALELLVSGRVLNAEQALSYGLVNRIVPSGQALESALELARQIAAKPKGAVRAVKRLLRGGIYLPSQSAAASERIEFPALWADEAHLQAVQRFVDGK